MNRNYKVIWNQSLNCFMAVAEYAKSRGKSSSGVVSSGSAAHEATGSTHLLRLSALCIGLASAGFSMQALAETGTLGGTSSQDSSTAISPTGAIGQCDTLGEAAITGTLSTNSTAIGCGTTIDDAPDSVAMGRENTVTATNGTQQQIGQRRDGPSPRPYPTGETFYTGTAVAVGSKNSVGTGGGVALGNGNQVTSTFHGVALGQGNVTSGGYAVGLGVGNLSSGVASVALGTANESTGNTSIAIGRQTYSRADYGIAAGNIATVEAGATNGIALGTSSNTSAVDGVAIGTNAQATGANSVALGQGSAAVAQTGNSYLTNVAPTADGTVSVGSNTIKRRVTNLADGAAPSDAVTVAQLQSTVSAGSGDNTTRSEGNMAALGGSYDSGTDTYTAPTYTLNNGNNDAGTTDYNDVGSALGNLDTRTTDNTADIAKGFNISAAGGTNDNVQLGESVNFNNTDGNLVVTNTVDNGINYDLADNISVTQATIGDATNSTVLTSTATGLDVGGDKITNLANGTVAAGSNDAVTGNQLNTTNQNVAANRTDINTNTDNIADNSNRSEGNMTALGGSYDSVTDTYTAPTYTLDDGTNTTTNTTVNTVGAALGNLDTRTTDNTADINKGISFGNGTTDNNFALGDTINVTGDSNLTSTTTADGVQVSLNESVDLGINGSVRTGNTTVNRSGVTLTGGTNQTVTLSNNGLNNGGNRITNVANGIAPEDAINRGQLDAVENASNAKINALGTSTASNLGSGASYDTATGVVSAPTYTLNNGNNDATTTGYNDVGSALGNLDGRTTTNTSDIADIQTQANQGFNINADNGTADNVKLGETVTFTNTDGNLVSTVSNNGINYDLAENINLGTNGSVSTGSTTVNRSGVTLIGGRNQTVTLSNNGLNNGGNRITRVADGLVDDDAATFGQVKDVDGKVDALGNSTASNLGGGASYNAATGAVEAPTYTLDNGDNDGNTTGYNDVGSALGNLDGRTTANTSGLADLASGKTGLVRQDTGTGAITVGAQTGGTSVNFTNIDGVNRQLTGVASAGDITQTANANNAVNAGDVNTAVGNLTEAGLNFQGDDGTLIDRNLGETLTITGGETDSNNLSAGNIGVVANGTDGLSVQLAKDIDLGADGSVTTGNTVTNSNGVKVDDGAGNATTITTAGTNVVDDQGNSADYTAASSSLTDNQGSTNVSTATGNTITTGNNVTTTTGTGTTVTDGTSTSNYGADGFIATDGTTSTVFNQAGVTFLDGAGDATGPSITASGIDAGGSTISNLADGVNANDAATKGQVDAVSDDLTDLTAGAVQYDRNPDSTVNYDQVTLAGTSVTTDTDTNGNTVVTSGGTTLSNVANGVNADDAVNKGQLDTVQTALTDTGLSFAGDSGSDVQRKLGETLTITGGETDSNNLSAGNIGVVANGTDGLSVQLAKDIDLGADGSVTTGNTVTNSNGVKVDDGAGNATSITTAGTSVTDGTNTSDYGADGFTVTDGTNSTTIGTGRISISGTDNTDPANPVSNTLVLDGNTGQISGVADATAADQAINKGQLDAIASAGDAKTDALGNSTANNLGGGASYNAATGVVEAPTYILNNGDNDGNTTGYNDVGSALGNLDGRTTANTSGLADLASGKTGLVRQDTGTGAITVGAQTGGTSVDFTNVGGDARQLTGVAAGTDATDAVNKAQLDAITGNITAGGVQYDRNNDNTVNYDRVSFNGAQAVIGKDDSDNDIVVSGGTTLTNVANGVNAADAVNKGQLDSATKVKVFDSSGDEVTINVAEQVANTSVDNDNLDSLFLTYDKTGQEVTDRLTIGQTVQKMNTEGVKFAHTNARDNGAGGVGITNDSSAGGFDSTAIGVNAIIKEGADSTVALGHDTEATETAKDSVVIGKGSKVSGASSVAIGDNAQANGTQSISIGTGNIVNGDNSGAFGDPSTINGNNSYSVGNNNTINSDDTFVIGNGITANQNGSVVLGLGSTATTGAGIEGFGAASNAAIAVTTSTTGAVAVGDAANNVYRQVTGVAAGTADSDAVNVSQLKAVSDALGDSNEALSNAAVQYDKNPDDTVNKGSITLGGAEGTTITNVADGVQASDAVNKGQLDNLGSGVAGIIGGDASYDADGNLTASNIGGTGKGNISDAIASINQGNAQANEDIQANNEKITENTGRLDAGISFGADNGDNISQSVGGNSGSIQFEGGNNITTSTTGGSIQIGLDGNIEVDSVTTGNTVVNDNGVTIQDGPSMTTEGFNAANTVITGVEAGNIAADSTDAINGSQLHALDKKLGDSVNALGYRIGEVEDDANAGISAAMAMSSLPQAYIPGKSMVGGGIASYNGESAVAVGVSKVSDNGRWVIKVNGTADTQGNAGGAIGAGFHF